MTKWQITVVQHIESDNPELLTPGDPGTYYTSA